MLYLAVWLHVSLSKSHWLKWKGGSLEHSRGNQLVMGSFVSALRVIYCLWSKEMWHKKNIASAAVIVALQCPRFSHHKSVLVMCCWSSLCSLSMAPISSFSLLTICKHTQAQILTSMQITVKWRNDIKMSNYGMWCSFRFKVVVKPHLNVSWVLWIVFHVTEIQKHKLYKCTRAGMSAFKHTRGVITGFLWDDFVTFHLKH